MKPSFLLLKSKHYSDLDKKDPRNITNETLFAEIGREELSKEPEYINTCALRMSLALLKCGVPIAGRLVIKNGPYKGRKLEQGAKNLADMLAQPSYLGKPTYLEPATALRTIGVKTGIAFFWKIFGYSGGSNSHIDLVYSERSATICHSHCYTGCREIWFWALK
jgi:Type VI secretion system (T6SS), amidase effector protein 4